MALEKTLESPLDCKEVQPVHVGEISPGCSLEGLMLKLKLQYFGHLMGRVDSLERTLMRGGIGFTNTCITLDSRHCSREHGKESGFTAVIHVKCLAQHLACGTDQY